MEFGNDAWMPGDYKTLTCLDNSSVAQSVDMYAVARWRFERRLPLGSSPVEVRSAFGGAALYKWAYLDGCRYSGRTAEGGLVCEHVSGAPCSHYSQALPRRSLLSKPPLVHPELVVAT